MAISKVHIYFSTTSLLTIMLCLFLSVTGSTQQILLQVLNNREDSVSIESVERSASRYLFTGSKDKGLLNLGNISSMRTIIHELTLPIAKRLLENRPAIEVTFENINVYTSGNHNQNEADNLWNVKCLIDSNTGRLLKIVMNPAEISTFDFQNDWIDLYGDVFNPSIYSVILPEEVSIGLLAALVSRYEELLSAIEIEAYYLHFSPKGDTKSPLLTPIDSTPVWILIAKFIDSSYSYSYREDTSKIDKEVYKRRPTIIYQVIHEDTERPAKRMMVTPSESDFFRKFPSFKRGPKK